MMGMLRKRIKAHKGGNPHAGAGITGNNEKFISFPVTLEDLYSHGTFTAMTAHAKRYFEVTVFCRFTLHVYSFFALPQDEFIHWTEGVHFPIETLVRLITHVSPCDYVCVNFECHGEYYNVVGGDRSNA
jgi:hypothetical protein